MKRSIAVFTAFLFVIVLGFSLSGCGGSEDEDLPSLTIDFETPADGIGDFQFYTNEEKNLETLFYDRFPNPKADQDDYEIIANKISGARIYGYGIVFCVKNIPELNSYEYYRVFITIAGAYQVMKKVVNEDKSGFEWIYIFPETGNNWPRSSYLKSGYNQNNALQVKKNGNTFTIYFNGQKETSFTDPTPLEGVEIGFSAAIGTGEEENFPNEPVDVRFSIVGD